MFWTEEKLAIRIAELEEYRYRDRIQIPLFNFQLEHGEIGTRPSDEGEWKTMRVGDRWEGRDIYAWLAADVTFPAEWKDRKLLGIFDFGKTGRGHNAGFESLLYLNGEPYQGVDSNHKEVFFSSQFAGQDLSFRFRLWSGLEGMETPASLEHRINRADLAWLDEATDDLYYTARAISETVAILDPNGNEYTSLLRALDRAFLRVDWSRPGSESFYGSIAEAQGLLHAELDKLEKTNQVTVRCIGHTHIDVAWLWRLKHTREKAARSFSTVLRLMDQYPDYVFLQTTPQLYEYIKMDYPDIYEKIRERIKEGRWEADGAMWLEVDCNLTSGESLVRQLLMGKKFFREEFGVECSYLWLPDVFGYSWALPQILRKSDIDTFMTTKISWNQYNRMPHDTFKWRGIDGTEILTHFITTPQADPNQSHRWWYTYNGVIKPHTVKGIWEGYRDKGLTEELLLAYGYGDGGGGVNREMLEMRRRLNVLPGVPNVITGRADEFFQSLHDKVNETDQYVHMWDGELYLEYHRGTYTSQAYNKRMNRKMELLYHETEWLQSLRSVLCSGWAAYPQEKINEGWKIILRNQFHDIIPGSSIKEVYEDSKLEYAEAELIGLEAWTAAAQSLVNNQDHLRYTVFHSAPWKHPGVVRIPVQKGSESGYWTTSKGQILRSQRSGEDWIIQMEELPSMGLMNLTYTPEQDQSQAIPFSATSSGVSTPYYDIEWNEKGQLTKIYDKEAKRQVLAEGTQGNMLQVFEDKPIRYEAWDIEIYYQEKIRQVDHLISVMVTETGPVRTVVRFEWRYMDSTIEQDMILYSESRRIDFQTQVDWHEKQQLLKVAFPVDIRSTEATFDIQYGNVKRPTHWNTSWDYARFESVGHQWVDLSETGYGVSLLNDCKYGHDIKNNVIRLSLIKSATFPDPEADQGSHIFTYALLPHQGSWIDGGTVQEAWNLNNPITYIPGETSCDFSLFELSSDHVMVDTVKKAENGNQLVLRVHEFTGRRGTVQINSDLTVQSWRECNLMEKPIGDQYKEQIIFEIKPYEIKTFLVDVSR
ncbi:alpha-mannosidase [Metabacillus arenae]|uniref:Alpha-mannosidase n=1 Tax=Metabacillus arenae TaxID=2771434 RepID=A0A926NMB9_9BACI|nr:alpha-mannosidase [Metabacillus arenae]MBD1383263.1 alpha-mannosidase [Metabacillus arenae]